MKIGYNTNSVVCMRGVILFAFTCSRLFGFVAFSSNVAGNPSSGCSVSSALALIAVGRTTKYQIEVDGLVQSYLLHVPSDYDSRKMIPLVLSHGGWGVSPWSDERLSGLTIASEREGFAVAYVRGYADNAHEGVRWTSFNTLGSVASSNTSPTCLIRSGSPRYCYSSCAARSQGCDSRGCDWTTCINSTKVSEAVLNDVEKKLCVDTTREYATGQSNGAMFSFRLGVALSHRLAAIAPVSGTFTYGHVATPSVPVPVMAVSGKLDRTIPVNATTKRSVSSSG